MSRLFVPQQHALAVRGVLESLGFRAYQGQIHQVRHAQQLMGIEGGTFAFIENHPLPVSAEMLDTVRRYGFVVIKLDDSFARARHQESEYRRSGPTAYDGAMARRAVPSPPEPTTVSKGGFPRFGL